jgi:hypothetical protein
MKSHPGTRITIYDIPEIVAIFCLNLQQLKATSQDFLLLESGHSIGTPLKNRVLPNVT